jgi:putative MATE family efflux protein
MGVECTAASEMHGVGISKPLMYIGIIRSLLNVLLDWIMIYGKFGCPALGIQGAALATVISNFVGFPVVLYIVFKAGHLPFRLSFRGTLRAPWKNYLPVIKLGLPSAGEEVLWNSGNLVLVRMLNSLGMGGAGIYTLIMQIESTPVLLYMGISKAAQTVVGNRTGERNIPLAIRDGMQCMRYTLYVSFTFVLIFLLFPTQVLKIFTTDASIIQTAAPFLMIAALYLLPKAVNITIGHGIRGFGDTRWMLYTQIFGTVYIITCATAMIYGFKLGVLGIFVAMGTDETIRAIINFIRFTKGERGKGHFQRDDQTQSQLENRSQMIEA